MTDAQAAKIITLLESIDSKLSSTNSGTASTVYTGKEAAEYLKISYFTLLNLVKVNAIKHSRIGKKLIFKKEFLDEILDAGDLDLINTNKGSVKGYVPQCGKSHLLGHGYGKLRKIKE